MTLGLQDMTRVDCIENKSPEVLVGYIAIVLMLGQAAETVQLSAAPSIA